jgi:L-seryl-tRNA(Ser) seleniumtransferase
MQPSKDSILRKIPSVDVLLQDAALKEAAAAGVPRQIVADAVRAAVEETRAALLAAPLKDIADEEVRGRILGQALRRIREAWTTRYRRAINATGIILHTGLGRAALPAAAVRQIADELAGYSLLQVDLETGKRSRRDDRIQWMLQQLTGAEAATIVNNNAAATMIVLNTVAKGKEVIVSRGQLVEIGGSFRLPEVMAASAARLVEVGTTNKTHPRDYENAVTENTAAILRVHPSNYRVYGFTAEVGLAELVRIAHERNLVLIDDVGAGALLDLSRFGMTDEPTLPDSIRQGADLVTSSADKLIGGPQGGLILGKAALVEKVRNNPLARILRVGKLTLAALEATLGLFFDEAQALRDVPTLEMLVRPLPQIAEQAERIARALGRQAPAADVKVIDGASQMGSGSLPTRDIPTRLVSVATAKMTPDALAAALRRRAPPVFARIQEDRVLFDPRTLLKGDEQPLVNTIAAVLASGE